MLILKAPRSAAAEAWEAAPLEVRAEMVAQQERRLRDRNSQLRVPRALTLAKKLALEGRTADRHPSSVPFQVQSRAQPPGGSTARKVSAQRSQGTSGRVEGERGFQSGVSGASPHSGHASVHSVCSGHAVLCPPKCDMCPAVAPSGCCLEGRGLALG